ncbi:MAG: S1 RNA-binding domain-containing protein, partial [Planctomycetota bacterium]
AEQHIDEEHEGVVTGVSPRGGYVQLSQYLAEGMIQTSDLPGDVTRGGKPPRWQIDKKTGALVDVNSGRSFNAGHLVRVRIVSIDLAKRQMDLAISDGGKSRAAGKQQAVPGLTLGGGAGGGLGGGFDEGRGAGFKQPGAKRRSQKSRSRDKRKKDFRGDRKGKGKRQ